MRVKFDQQLEHLHLMLIEMGALCEEAITYAIKGLEEDSSSMIAKTFATDELIDNMEREIETICLKLLLQQQPVAGDLRLISSALKMISDMERIGDQAYDIAEITKTIKEGWDEQCREDIRLMSDISISMVSESIDSFVKNNIELANDVIIKDDKVDALFVKVKERLIASVAKDSSCGEYFADILMIAKYLERISDHAVNIAEWVIFSITGKHVNKEHDQERN